MLCFHFNHSFLYVTLPKAQEKQIHTQYGRNCMERALWKRNTKLLEDPFCQCLWTMFTSYCVWPQIHQSIISVSKRNPEIIWFRPKTWATVWSTGDFSEVFPGWWSNSLMIFFHDISWGSEELSFECSYSSCCTLHQNLFHDILRIRLCTVCLYACVSQLLAVYASVPEDRAILNMHRPCSHLHYVWGGACPVMP